YRAKAQGRGKHTVFQPAMHAHARKQLQLETDLRRALDRGELRLNYQPVVSLSTGLISSCEALVNWLHPQKGLVTPGDFIPAAEETGLIIPLGKWALEQACRDASGWNARGHRVSVSVNLSSRQLQGEVIDHVRQAI